VLSGNNAEPTRVEDASQRAWQTFSTDDGQIDHTIDGKSQTTSFDNDLAGRLLAVSPTATSATASGLIGRQLHTRRPGTSDVRFDAPVGGG